LIRSGDADRLLLRINQGNEEMSKKPLPEVERFPTLYYEEGIGGLQLSLRVRHIIACQHWLGNADYSFHDLMHEIMPVTSGSEHHESRQSEMVDNLTLVREVESAVKTDLLREEVDITLP
jgi:hypothetical protein